MVAATPEAAHAAQAGRSPGFTPREVRTRIQYHAPFLLVDNLPPRPLVILLDNVRHWGLHLPTGCCWVRLVMRLRLPTAWLGLALGVGAGPGKPSERCSLGVSHYSALLPTFPSARACQFCAQDALGRVAFSGMWRRRKKGFVLFLHLAALHYTGQAFAWSASISEAIFILSLGPALLFWIYFNKPWPKFH